MLMVESLPTKVLFDLGAINSFISIDLVLKIEKPKKELMKILLVSAPLGRILPASEGISECEIKIGKVTTKIDLVVLELKDFDIILRMDWLYK